MAGENPQGGISKECGNKATLYPYPTTQDVKNRITRVCRATWGGCWCAEGCTHSLRWMKVLHPPTLKPAESIHRAFLEFD